MYKYILTIFIICFNILTSAEISLDGGATIIRGGGGLAEVLSVTIAKQMKSYTFLCAKNPSLCQLSAELSRACVNSYQRLKVTPYQIQFDSNKLAPLFRWNNQQDVLILNQSHLYVDNKTPRPFTKLVGLQLIALFSREISLDLATINAWLNQWKPLFTDKQSVVLLSGLTHSLRILNIQSAVAANADTLLAQYLLLESPSGVILINDLFESYLATPHFYISSADWSQPYLSLSLTWKSGDSFKTGIFRIRAQILPEKVELDPNSIRLVNVENKEKLGL